MTSTAATISNRALVPGRSRGYLSTVFQQLRRNRGAMIGLAIICLEVALALAAPWVAPYDSIEGDIFQALRAPSAQHLLGTDELGHDLLSRIIYGARISLRIGLIAVAIAGTIGILLGTVAGFYGGKTDEVIIRGIDVLMAFPGMLLALTIITVLGPGLFNIMIAVGIGSIPSFTRVARGETLSVKAQEYITGARVVGCSNSRMLLRYVLPNVLPSLIVLSTMRVASAILAAAGLNFLGLGAQPPAPEWGAILNAARPYMRRAWWLFTFPGLAIMLTVLSMNLFGDGLRDALDPKLRQR